MDNGNNSNSNASATRFNVNVRIRPKIEEDTNQILTDEDLLLCVSRVVNSVLERMITKYQ
jgi:hypothetical protein